ncbi:MAG TPA: sulfatase [Nitrospiria bacterium]
MPKYNIVLVIVDSWNRNFVGCFNEGARIENLTPNLDAFSKECVTFTSAYSAGVRTAVSALAILSGCCPCRYGDWYKSVSPKRTMLSQILQKNGYSTYGFTANPCTSSWRKFEKGFNVFRDDGILFKNMHGPLLEALLLLKTLLRDPYSSGEELNFQIRQNFKKDKLPYFVSLHYMDIHGPYISRSGWQFKNRMEAGSVWKKATISPEKINPSEKEKMLAVYKEKMKYLDSQIGELLNENDDSRSMIIITGDHGDLFGTRGYYGHPDIFCNEMINVPLFIKFPQDLEIKSQICSYPVSLMDLVPTVLDVLDIQVNYDFDGNSLMPLMYNRESDYKTKFIISEQSRNYACAINGEWKMIANYGESIFELYNWKEDYGEKINLINEKVEIRDRLEAFIRNHIEKNRPVTYQK